MKKLLSFLAAGVLAFGLIGCSGDLHDVGLIDLTGYGIIGSMTGWKTDTSLLKDNKDGTYSFEFTYADGDSFAVNKDNDWTTAYRWDGDTSDKNPAKFTAKDTAVKVYCGDSPFCMPLPCASVGDTVTVLIKPYPTYLEMTASIKVAEPMYIAIDNAVASMVPTGKEGEYSYQVTGTGSDIEFKVFDGTDSYGLAASAYATSSTSLVKKGKATVKLSTGDGAKYTIYVTKSSKDLSVITKDASYKTLYSIASLNSNYGNYDITWTADGAVFKATVTIPAGTSNTWNQTDTTDVEFGVCDTESWGTKFTGATLSESNKPFDLELGNGNNNKITGVNPSENAVVITLVSTDEKITASYAQ